MADIHDEVESLRLEIEKANAVVTKAVNDRRVVTKENPQFADLQTAVITARQALVNLEMKLRTLYECREQDQPRRQWNG